MKTIMMLALLATASFAAAQDKGPKKPASGKEGVSSKIEDLREKMRAVNEAERTEVLAARNDASKTEEARQAAIKDIRAKYRAQRQALHAEQRAEREAHRAEMQKVMEKAREQKKPGPAPSGQ